MALLLDVDCPQLLLELNVVYGIRGWGVLSSCEVTMCELVVTARSQLVGQGLGGGGLLQNSKRSQRVRDRRFHHCGVGGHTSGEHPRQPKHGLTPSCVSCASHCTFSSAGGSGGLHSFTNTVNS